MIPIIEVANKKMVKLASVKLVSTGVRNLIQLIWCEQLDRFASI